MDNWLDFVSVFVNGPGWFPGTSRLGDVNGVPQSPHRKIYDPKIPYWANMYVLLHFIIVLMGVENLAKMSEMSQLAIFGIGIYFIWSLTSLGLLLDKSVWGWVNEALRTMICLIIQRQWNFLSYFPEQVTSVVFITSFIIASISVFAHLILVQEIVKNKGE